MRFERRHTKEGRDPFSLINFRSATSEIKTPTGLLYSVQKILRCLSNSRRWQLIF